MGICKIWVQSFPPGEIERGKSNSQLGQRRDFTRGEIEGTREVGGYTGGFINLLSYVFGCWSGLCDCTVKNGSP